MACAQALGSCVVADISIARNTTRDIFATTGCGGASIKILYESRNCKGGIMDVLSNTAFLYPNTNISILFHQGESDNPTTSNTTYLKYLKALKDDADNIHIADWFISRATICGTDSPNNNIRNAQWSLPGTFRGPDTDVLGIDTDVRYDTCHFNTNGLEKLGQLWKRAIDERIPCVS